MPTPNTFQNPTQPQTRGWGSSHPHSQNPTHTTPTPTPPPITHPPKWEYTKQTNQSQKGGVSCTLQSHQSSHHESSITCNNMNPSPPESHTAENQRVGEPPSLPKSHPHHTNPHSPITHPQIGSTSNQPTNPKRGYHAHRNHISHHIMNHPSPAMA